MKSSMHVIADSCQKFVEFIAALGFTLNSDQRTV